MSETPKETLTRWLLHDGIGISMLGAPPEVREAIRAVLASEFYWREEARRFCQDSIFHQEQRFKAEAERDELRVEVERLRGLK
jgi:hypothetical protein